MWMMAADKICPLINCQMSKCFLVFIRNFLFFISPVKDNNDQLCTILFYFGNILFQLFFPAKMIIQLIDSYQPYFDTLYFCNSSLIIAKMKDIRCIQSLQCIIETFLTIVMAVIICCINSFYRACCKYICVGSGCLKGKLLVFSFRRFCKSSFKICNCQVILRKNTFYICHKIVRAIIFVICIQAGIIIEVFVSSQCTVADNTEC